MDLTVTDLAIARGGIPVLAHVSFALRPGRALVLRGPNGIGKTTLLRTIAGLQPPLAGKIGLPAEDIAYAGHADGIKATLSVTENLRFWARIFGTGDIAPALAAMDLEGLALRAAHSLSAGQKRRLGLARFWSPDAASGFWTNRPYRLTRPRSRCSRPRCARILPGAARP